MAAKMNAKTPLLLKLKHAIDNGQLLPGKSRAGDWLRLITDTELEGLNGTFEEVARGNETPEGITDALCSLIALLMLEKGVSESLEPLAFSMEEMQEYTKRLASLCALEALRRRGMVSLEPTGITDENVKVGPGHIRPLDN